MTLKQEVEELKKRIEVLEQRPITYPTYQPIYGPQYPMVPQIPTCPRCGGSYLGQTHQCYYLGNQSICQTH